MGGIGPGLMTTCGEIHGNSGQSIVRGFFVRILGLSRDSHASRGQERDQPPQFPDFLLLLYDNRVQLINRFFKIQAPDLDVFHSFLHLSSKIHGYAVSLSLLTRDGGGG